jgi:fatty-acyl-CoA synthase
VLKVTLDFIAKLIGAEGARFSKLLSYFLRAVAPGPYHLGVNHDDVYLHAFMFHANGWGGVCALTATGGTHVCLRKVDPPFILDLFDKKKITLLCGAPTVVNMLVNDPKAKEIKITTNPRMATAGAPPAAALIKKSLA